MSLKDIISQLLERGAAMQTFWGFYITVALGVIAFFGSAQRKKSIAALVSLVFVAFAFVNCGGMRAISAQRNFLYGVLSALQPSSFSPPATPLDMQLIAGFVQLARPDSPGEVVAFHVAADVAVLAAIWFLALWPRDGQRSAADSAKSSSAA